MINVLLLIILHLFYICDLISAEKYIFITIPKSGSHLIDHLVVKFAKENQVISPNIDESFGKDRSFYPPHNPNTYETLCEKSIGISIHSHMNFGYLLRRFSEEHPEYKKIMIIRDPRDVCISTIHYVKWVLDIMYPQKTFEERLQMMIKNEGIFERWALSMESNLEELLNWYFCEDVNIFTFEEMIGEKGGGSSQLQKESIKRVASNLNYALSDEELATIMNNLWGKSNTFRKGIIGDWKNYFTEEHKQTFKEKYGEILICIGYENDLNW